MPQTKEVEQFLQLIGPFYEVVEDESTEGGATDTEGGATDTGGGDKEGGDSDTEGEDTDTGGGAGKEGGDSDTEGGAGDTGGGDSELEYEDSYDDLPETTPTSKPTLIRRDTPYFKQVAPVAVDTDAIDTIVVDTSSKENSCDRRDRERGVRFSDTVMVRPTTPDNSSSTQHIMATLQQIQQSLQV